jgi:opacity protein-like surface antigen
LKKQTLVVLGMAVTISTLARAGDPAEVPVLPDISNDGWRLRLTPYLWIPAQKGDVAIKGFPASVDLDIGDTFDTLTDNFNFGLTLHAELQRGDLAFFGDAMYLSLETGDIPVSGTTATVRQDTGVFELGAAYRLFDVPRADGSIGYVLEPLAGARAHYLSIEIDPAGQAARSGDEFWVDGFVGLRAVVGLTERVNLRLRGDIGAGESDLTWSALAGVEFRFAERASFEFGYRALDTDYSTGGGSDRFEYDVLLHGPYIGLTLNF